MDRLRAMEAFVLVVNSGSFSAAARRLNVGQPALSKSIAHLEDRLGVKLLVRTTRGLAPTEAGLNFYERARRSIEEADEAELAARGAGASLTGKLCVSAAVTFARIHLMPRLPEFLAQHPDVEMEIVLDDRNIDLVREGIDVALRMGKLAEFVTNSAADRNLSARGLRHPGLFRASRSADDSERPRCASSGDLWAARRRRGLAFPAGRRRTDGHPARPVARQRGRGCACGGVRECRDRHHIRMDVRA